MGFTLALDVPSHPFCHFMFYVVFVFLFFLCLVTHFVVVNECQCRVVLLASLEIRHHGVMLSNHFCHRLVHATILFNNVRVNRVVHNLIWGLVQRKFMALELTLLLSAVRDESLL